MKKVVIGMVVFLVAILIFVHVLATGITPAIKGIASKEVERFCQLIVNHAGLLYTNITDDLVKVERDSNDQVFLIDFDMIYATKVATELVLQIEELLLSLEDGLYESTEDSIYDSRLQTISDNKGVIATIPLGLLSNNPLLAGTGPNLKIRYKTISQVSSSVLQDVRDYGINRMMVGITIAITIHLRVIVPFYQEDYSHEIHFPLSLEIIEGQVPQWYQN
jgi:sporulation protein YunB